MCCTARDGETRSMLDSHAWYTLILSEFIFSQLPRINTFVKGMTNNDFMI